jgi:hypothetical protein
MEQELAKFREQIVADRLHDREYGRKCVGCGAMNMNLEESFSKPVKSPPYCLACRMTSKSNMKVTASYGYALIQSREDPHGWGDVESPPI